MIARHGKFPPVSIIQWILLIIALDSNRRFERLQQLTGSNPYHTRSRDIPLEIKGKATYFFTFPNPI
jgi:hypothetical protein